MSEDRITIDEKGIKIGKARIPIVSDEEAEKADAVVCGARNIPTPWDATNIDALCAWCGADIKHRPHVPKTPPKICIGCAIASRN